MDSSFKYRLWPLMAPAVLLACVGPRSASHLERFEFSEPQMGVPFRMVLYTDSEQAARTAAKAAFARVAELNQHFSDYETDSELNLLSRTSGSDRWVPVSADLWHILKLSQDLAHRSWGGFDITVGPCVSLWRKARREQAMPERARLVEARAAVGFQKLMLEPETRSAKLLAPRMKLDLGGIAKGYAVDEALKILREHGISRALVAGAGDIAVSDPPPGRRGWRIELPGAESTNGPLAAAASLAEGVDQETRFIFLRNAAIATSGDLFQFLEIDGKRYSHIVDPRTGVGLTDRSLVTVIAKDCTTADSLATAVSVLGPEAGLSLLSHVPGARARVTRKPGENIQHIESPNWPQ